MTSSNLHSVSNVTKPIPAHSFRERRRRQDELARLRDVDDEELAGLIVRVDEPDHDLACEVLLERFRPMLAKHSRRICSQLGHWGRPCPGFGCIHAFNAAMGEFASRLTGQRYAYAPMGRASAGIYFTNANARARRTVSPSSAVSRWLKRTTSDPDRQLCSAVSSELQASGRATDVRRQWNQERGLLARANLPRENADTASSWITVRRRYATAEVRDLLDRASPAHDATKWAAYFYDDACDNAPPDVLGPYDQRLARSVGWNPLEDHQLPAIRVVFDIVIEALKKADGGEFWRRHMDAAYQHSRVGRHQPLLDETLMEPADS